YYRLKLWWYTKHDQDVRYLNLLHIRVSLKYWPVSKPLKSSLELVRNSAFGLISFLFDLGGVSKILI
ncbi:hypothetical protein CEQ90_13555, partial [Lewinellaceae bacterium SD302]